jgi:plastocyanin
MVRGARLALLGVVLLGAAPATGSLAGTLATPGVVWISDGSNPAPSTHVEITQHDRTFIPALTVVTAGSDVTFRNDDDVDHSVYSVSPADPFDLGIYEPGPGKDVRFAVSGVIEIRCHIHRHMHATLLVVDGPVVQLDAPGPWTLRGVRPGHHVLHVWTADDGERTSAVDVR